MSRSITYAQAINEALDQSMAADSSVYVMGLGVPDPKGIFGTTMGLQEKYGSERVMDMPTSENGMTGMAIGSALVGMRPIITHQRIDFALLSMEQIVNQAANWHYMFGGQARVPIVIRMVIGRGWGQGPQHSQNLQAWFAHVPGLKVVMPTTAQDAKGLLIASIEDDNPVVFLEHRWLHNVTGEVPEEAYRVPLGKAKMMREGSDLTIAATSHMTLEAMRAADQLAEQGVEAEVIDMRSLRPLDVSQVQTSVAKTGHLIVADTGWTEVGVSAEIVVSVVEKEMASLVKPPRRIGLPPYPSPTSHSLARAYYPRAVNIAMAAMEMLDKDAKKIKISENESLPLDIPDKFFSGPF